MEGFKAPSTDLPGVIKEGTFYQWRERIFWNVHDTDKTDVIQPKNEHHSRLAIEVEHPPAMIASIKQPLGRLRW